MYVARPGAYPRLAGAILLSLALTACEQGFPERGLSVRDAEWQRQGDNRFSILSAGPDGAVVLARGRPVAVDPAPGFCVVEDSVETSDRSAFALIGDCANLAAEDSTTDGNGELTLPPSVPGIITVSISGDPGFVADGNGQVSVGALREFLTTAEGRAILGRSGNGDTVTILEMREDAGTLLVHVEDRVDPMMPFLSTDFWRAFVELNDRLTVVTINGFRDRPMGKEDMLVHLMGQVQALQVANLVPPEVPETQYAEAPEAREPVSAAVLDLVQEALADARAQVAGETVAQDGQPVPRPRPGSAAAARATVEQEEVASAEVVDAAEDDEVVAEAPATDTVPATAIDEGRPAETDEEPVLAEASEVPERLGVRIPRPRPGADDGTGEVAAAAAHEAAEPADSQAATAPEAADGPVPADEASPTADPVAADEDSEGGSGWALVSDTGLVLRLQGVPQPGALSSPGPESDGEAIQASPSSQTSSLTRIIGIALREPEPEPEPEQPAPVPEEPAVSVAPASQAESEPTPPADEPATQAEPDAAPPEPVEQSTENDSRFAPQRAPVAPRRPG